MKNLFCIVISVFLIGCGDCIQELDGNVMDKDSKILLTGVKIWKENKPNETFFTGEYGGFSYSAVSNGTLGCPDFSLVFHKEGYYEKVCSFAANKHDTVEIFLEKNYQLFGLRPAILDTVKLIENDNFISTGVVGYAGRKPKEFDRRQWLMMRITGSR